MPRKGKQKQAEQRLDERGYHLTSVTRLDAEAIWHGEVRILENREEATAVEMCQPPDRATKVIVKAGDFVYTQGPRKGHATEIVRIETFCKATGEQAEEDIAFYYTWFWRPERVPISDDLEWHDRELFLDVAQEPEEQFTAAIELSDRPNIIFVNHPDDVEPGALEQPHTYFCWRYYDPLTSRVSAMPARGATPTDQTAAPEAEASEPAADAPAPRRRNATALRVAALEAENERQRAQIADLVAKLETLTSRVAELECKVDEGGEPE